MKTFRDQTLLLQCHGPAGKETLWRNTTAYRGQMTGLMTDIELVAGQVAAGKNATA